MLESVGMANSTSIGGKQKEKNETDKRLSHVPALVLCIEPGYDSSMHLEETNISRYSERAETQARVLNRGSAGATALPHLNLHLFRSKNSNIRALV